MPKLSLLFVALAFLGVKCTSGQNDTIAPSTDVNLMAYYYYSSASPTGSIIQYNNSDTIVSSGFNTALETIILIDGFLSNFTNSNMTKELKNVMINNAYDGNIIIVDWGALSGGNSGLLYSSLTKSTALLLYPAVVTNSPAVGKRLAEFIQFLGVPTSSVSIMGHSEGAHIAGIAGKYYQNLTSTKLPRITGLDPAGPLYLYLGLNITQNVTNLLQANQIDSTVATFVDCYHTGRGPSAAGVPVPPTGGGFGTVGTSTGTVDVFVNGGDDQPGCNKTFSTNPADQAIATAYCNHKYSWQSYARSIPSTATYNGCTCTLGLPLIGVPLVPGTLLSCAKPGPPGSCNGVPLGYRTSGTSGPYYITDTTLAY